MPKRRFTCQPKRVIRTIVYENDGGALLPSRFVFPADCAPVNGHRIRGRLHQEQAHGSRIYRFCPCIFLLIQAKYRESTGTASHFRFASRPHGEERAPISGLPEIGIINAQVGYSRPACASRTMGRLHRSRPRPVLRDGASRLLRTRMSSHANARRCGRRAQFQLWIFSYTVWARSSKKWVSRVMLSAVAAPVVASILASQAMRPRSRASTQSAPCQTNCPPTRRGGSRAGLPSSCGFAEAVKTCEFVCANCRRVRACTGGWHPESITSATLR